jgi:sialate O-acetylesterase
LITTTRIIPTARLVPKAVPYLGVKALVAVLSALIFSPQSWALDTPSIFGSGMVLQREKPVVVWGWTAPGDVVDLSFADQSRSATADPAGRWEILLDPVPASSEPRRMTISSAKGDTRVYDNVLVGDVWILAGQSNMGWPLSKCDGGAGDTGHRQKKTEPVK